MRWRPRGPVGGRVYVLEVGAPVGQFGPARRAEEEFRAVGGGDGVQRGVLRRRGGAAGRARAGPRRGGRRRPGRGDSRPTRRGVGCPYGEPERTAGPVLTRTRASPCSQRSTGLPRWRAVRAKPRRGEEFAEGFGVAGDQFGEGDAGGDDGRGQRRGMPASSWRTSRERRASTAVGPASAWRKTSLKTSSESGPVVAGAQDVSHQSGDVEAALAGEAAVVAAPLEDVHGEQRGVGELEEEDLLAGDVLDALRSSGRSAGQDVEAVQAGAERGVAGRLDDAPGVVVGADVPSPGERLVGDPDAEVLCQVGEFAQLLGGERVVVHRVRGDAGADQDGVGAEPAHQLELVPGAAQVAGELLVRHRLDVPHRLVEVDAQAEVGAAGADLLGGERAREQVVLEDLDAVEAGPGGGRELLGEGSAEGDGGDGLTHTQLPRARHWDSGR